MSLDSRCYAVRGRWLALTVTVGALGMAGAACSTPGGGAIDDAPAIDAGVDGLSDGPSDASGDAAPDAAVDAAPDAPPPPPPAVVLYPAGTRHSPITPTLVARIQQIAAAGSHDVRVFAKVGDSITASADFVRCFDGSPDLGNHTSLAATISDLRSGNAAGTSPFGRISRAAVGGTTASDVLAAPSTLQQEIADINPRFAVVMFGTNDVRQGMSMAGFAADLWTVIDDTIARGVVPIMSTIPSLAGDPDAPRVPTFNLVVRAIAQGRGVPLVDLYGQLAPLPNRGLSSDDVHPSTAPVGACSLTDASLQYGYNVRNLVTIEALERARAALAGTASDATASMRTGSGTATDPFVGALPLLDLGDTRTGTAAIASYPCNATPQGGREVVYRIDVASSMTIEATAVDRNGVDVHVHLLAGAASPQACVASGNPRASAVVGPGPVYIAVDTASGSTEGEFVLVVQRL